MANPEWQSSEVQPSRGIFLTVMAVLFVVLALSDFTKALQFMNDPSHGGLVMFGHKFQSVGGNAIFGPLLGVFLLCYAYGIWKMRSWVLRLAIPYAFYVPLNLVLYSATHRDEHPALSFIVPYLAIALTGSVGTAIYLVRHRSDLR